jgi:hypothetical protein
MTTHASMCSTSHQSLRRCRSCAPSTSTTSGSARRLEFGAHRGARHDGCASREARARAGRKAYIAREPISD